jgi:hypothetical protein
VEPKSADEHILERGMSADQMVLPEDHGSLTPMAPQRPSAA